MEESRYKYIIDNSKDAITLINREYVYELANATYCEGIGNTQQDVLGHTVQEVWGEEKFRTTIKGYLDRCFSGEQVDYIEEFHFGPFMKYMHVTYYPFLENGEITSVLVFSHDITNIGRLENQLNHYEYRDPLTGLFNRRSLDVILDKELDRAQRSDRNDLRVLIFIQIKNIETAVELYGQEYGDLLLENTGIRLQSKIRKSDYVFRYDGSVFAVLLSKIENRLDAGQAANKIYDTITFPYSFKGHDIVVGCSIGAAVFPADGTQKEELIQKATSAMMQTVRDGKRFTLYNQELYRQALRRIAIESAACRALEEQQFQLYYQPIVDQNFHIVGAEALLRWKHPELGDISPGEFIPMAERTDLIFALGKWILFSVCRRLSQWQERYGIYVSINLSSREFSSPDLLDNVKAAIGSSRLKSPQSLKIEITENESVKNIDESVSRMRALAELGVEVFIDDFGTGNSSLQYLKRLPAEVLKIDREFVKEIDTNSEEHGFLNHIVHMAFSRGKEVLIEGVENARQAELLLQIGCRRMQGFYFSKAVEASRFEELLERGAALPEVSAG
jgi:diguanylate cyclase (GGDEF)-like protein/PAS domain S-box-containing protein